MLIPRSPEGEKLSPESFSKIRLYFGSAMMMVIPDN